MSGPDGPIATAPPAAPDRVRSARLVLERPRMSDLDAVAALLGDPRVGRWLGGTLDRDAAAGALERWIAHWDAHRFGLWCARDAATGDLVGRGGLHSTLVDGGGAIEAGWTIAAGRWGEGLATELGAAAIAVAERDLGIRELVSFTLPDNAGSRRVMEKLGFSYSHDITHAGLPHVLYRWRNEPVSSPGPGAAPAA